MANKITYDVGFNVENSSLVQLKSELNNIQQMSLSQFKIIDANGSIGELKKIQTVARQVGDIIESSFNPKLNSVNVEAFNQKLAASGLTLQQISVAFNSAGNTGKRAFQTLTTELLTSNRQLRETHGLLAKMGETLGNTIKWSLASGAINLITGSVQKAWSYTKKLDESLNNIRIVTGQSAEDMDKFAKKANNAAKALGTATTQYTDASLIYYQQGLSDKEVQARTEVTLKAANVTGQSAAEVSEQLTAVWNGYKVVAEEAELYVDKLAAVAASTAADLEELSTGMSKVASAANTMGVDIDQLSAQLSTIVSVTRQDASLVGTALKTIYARMGDLKVDGVDEFGTSLGDVSGQMRQMGIEVLDQEGNLRDMGAVIEEVAKKWGTWTDAQQQAAAVAIAGKRQYNNLIALFENWDMYEEALSVSQTSKGTLQKQQDTYMDSLEAHLTQLAAAGEKVFDAFFNSDSMKDLIDFVTGAVEGFANLIEAVGGGGNALMMLGGVAGRVLGPQIGSFIGTWVRNQQNLNYNINQTKAELEVLHQLENTNAPKEQRNMERLIELKKQQLMLEGRLTEAQRAQNNEHLKRVAESLRAQEEVEDSLNALNEQYQEMQGTKDTKNKTRKTIDFNASGLEGTTSDIEDEAEQRISTAKSHVSRVIDKGKNLEQEKQGLENELAFASGEIELSTDGLLISGSEDAEKVLELKKKIKDIDDQIALQQQELAEAEKEHTNALEAQKRLKENQVDLNTAISETQNIASFSVDLTDSAKRASGYTADIQDYDKQTTAYKQQYGISGDIDFAAEAQKIQKDKSDPSKNQKEVKKQAKALKTLQQAQEKATTAQRHYKAAGQDVAKMLKDVTSGQDKNTKLTQAAQNAIIKVKTENILFSQALDKVAKGEALTAQEAAAYKRGLEDIEAAARESSEQADELTEALSAQKAQIDENNAAIQENKQALEDTLNAQKAEQMANNVTQVVGGLTALAGAVQTVANMGDIWQNQDLSTGEKVLQTIMAILGVLGSVITVVPIIQTIIKATGKTTRAELDATGKAGKTAGVSIQVAFWPILLITLAIVATLGIIIGLCALFGKETKSASERAREGLENARKNAEKSQEAFQNAKDAYAELLDKMSDYKDAKLALEELRIGTEEWQQAVAELNGQVLDLVTQYPTLLEFMESDEQGVLSISQEGWDKVLEEQLKQVNDARTQATFSQIMVRQHENNVIAAEYAEDKNAVLENTKAAFMKDDTYFTNNAKEDIDFKALATQMVKQEGTVSGVGYTTDASAEKATNFVLNDEYKDDFDIDKISSDIDKNLLEAITMDETLWNDKSYKNIDKLAEALEDNYDEVKNLTQSMANNTKQAEALTDVYMQAIAAEIGVADQETWTNLAETYDPEQLEEKLNIYEKEYWNKYLEADAGSDETNDEENLEASMRGAIQDAFGTGVSITEMTDNWSKIEGVESFKEYFSVNIDGVTYTGAQLMEKYGEDQIKAMIARQNEALTEQIDGYANKGINTKAAYFSSNVDQELADSGRFTKQDLTQIQSAIDSGKITDSAVAENLAAYQTKFNEERDSYLKGTIFEGKEDSTGFINFTLDDYKALQSNLAKAEVAGGGEAISALFQKYENDASAMSFINEKMQAVNWGDTSSIQTFLSELSKQGILIDQNDNAWTLFMDDVYNGTRQWITNSEQVIESLATIKELAGDIQIGDILSEEDYKRLLAISPEIANMFIKTADGYKALANSKDLDKALKKQYQSLGELKLFYNDVASELDLSGVTGSLSVDFNKSGDVLDYMSNFASSENVHNYDKLFDYAGTSRSAISAAYEYVNTEEVDTTSAEYIEYLNLLKTTANKINQAALDKENNLLNSRQGQEIWATEIASSWGEVAANQANLDEDVYNKAEAMWKNTYLTEMGFSGATAFNLGATELEEHLETIRKLELDYYQDINAELDILSGKIDKAFGADRVALLEEQAQLQEENLARANEQARMAQNSFDSIFAGFLSGAYETYGVTGADLTTDTGELDLVALRNLQANYSSDSNEYADIENLISMWSSVNDAAATASEAAWSLIDAEIEAFKYQTEIQNQLNETAKQWMEFGRKFKGYATGDLDVYGGESAADMINNAFEDYAAGKGSLGNWFDQLDKMGSIMDNYNENIDEYNAAAAVTAAANEDYIAAQKDLIAKQDAYNTLQAQLDTAYELKSDAQDAQRAVAERIAANNPYAAVAEDGSLLWDETAFNEDWENYLSEAQGTLEDMQGQLQNLYEGYLQAQDELMGIYDTEINKLTTINSILQGSADLWKMVGKNVEGFSNKLTGYYQSITSNTAKTYDLANVKLQIAQTEYQKVMALGEQASDEMIQTVSDNLAAATEGVVSAASEWMTAIANEFSVTMSAAIDDFITQATGMDLAGITEDWNLTQAQEDRYLDDVNATYSIDNVERNFQKSIDATDSITAQKKLNSVMQEQLKILREKDKLSQYDIDRANAMYELTLKQIALEEAQQTANKMKLTRDASGNYTYQYVADQDAIAQAEEELAAAENELYNLDKERNKTLVDEYYATMSEANEAIAAAMAEGDTERVERLKDYYFGEGGLLSGIQSELEAAQVNLQGIGSSLMGSGWTSSLASFTNAIVDSNLSQLASDVGKIVDDTSGTLETVSQTISSLLSEGSVLDSSLDMITTSLKSADDIAAETQELMIATHNVLTELPVLTQEIDGLAEKLESYGEKYQSWLEQQTGETAAITENTLALAESTEASRAVARAIYESMGLDVPAELAQDAET